MKQVGVYEAKTQLPKLLEQVEQGETVVITRHGKPIARLLPVEFARQDVGETIRAIREFRKGKKLNGLKVKDLIDEGRRH